MRQLVKRILIALFFVVLTTASTVVVTPVTAQAQIGVHVGVDIPVFPRLVVVPGYPVYYAPAVRANYFFYDGFFWVFNVDDGYWYSSTWYNGPWVAVEPAFIPQPILVIPYRYYRVRPAYWGGWAYDRPPRWDVFWGPSWVESRRGWDHWDRNRRWAAAPLPVFQRDFPRDRYPSPDRQVTIYRERYNYRPRDVVFRDHQTTIIERQSRGGERASSRAAFLEQKNENRQARENVREQDKARRQENVQQDKSRREANVQSERQRQENARDQRQSNVQQDKARRQENVQQDKTRREANVQAERQRQENLRDQRQSNVQQDKARRQENVQQDKARRDANVQAERQRQENLRAQHQANVQERGQRERKAPEKPDDRG
jgi:hypothetical protein